MGLLLLVFFSLMISQMARAYLFGSKRSAAELMQ